MYHFLLAFSGNIWPKSAPLRDTSLQNPRDLEFNIWRSLKVKSGGPVALPVMIPNSVWINLVDL